MYRARRRFALNVMAVMASLGVAAAMTLSLSAQAQAQQAGVNTSRDCQTLRTCNFTRNGKPRGCLSSYTCRTCKMVAVKCNIGGRTVCSEMVCRWGG